MTRALLALAAMLLAAPGAEAAGEPYPIRIARQGAFAAGGTLVGDPDKASLSCDHGMVEFQIPVRARRTALFLWHSSSTVVWDRRWDGGEGYRSIFLRRRYPVYLWDGPRVGRANWGCESYPFTPAFGRDQANFVSWRLGARYPEWFPGVQFPKDDPEAWNQALRARYQEFDTAANVPLQAAAAAAAIDRIGPSVLVTNSAAGFRAQLAAIRSGNVKAIVAYEDLGYVFPEGEGPSVQAGPPNAAGAFGPLYVSREDFAKLARVPMQFVWGDNIDKSSGWAAALAQCREFVARINAHGGRAEVLVLPEIGIRGNTHIAFADMNNVAVADQLSAFLKRHGLDR